MIFDTRAKTISHAGHRFAPTPHQWAYLSTLAAHPGWLYTREQLLSAARAEFSYPRTVDAQLKRVRIKFRAMGWPEVILSRYGEGYLWSQDQPVRIVAQTATPCSPS